MRRKIECNESDIATTLPYGYQWLRAYRRKSGSPLGTDEYMVRSRSDAGSMETRHDHCATLTEARKHAKAIVRNGKAWAEIFRWAENGQGMRKVFIASYEVALESGSEVA